MKNSRIAQAVSAPSTTIDIGQLNESAVEGLAPMFDAESQLFCYRLKQSQSGLVREGLSRRYTMMTLLGLRRSEAAGFGSPIEIRAVLGNLLQDTTWIENIGDLGLLLWTCAVISPERLSENWSGTKLQMTFDRYREVREGRTMELAWFLSGLAHATLACPDEFRNLEDLAHGTFRLLRWNQGDSGIFGHLSGNATVAGFLRGRIGSFADQVYPIYALSKCGQAYAMETAIEMARKCADAICRVQGLLGQWWWHYDAKTGRVLGKYPVYSVHQEGMAPMAFFALEEAAHLDYTEPVYRGLRWIGGSNELGYDLRHGSGLVWRCLYHGSRYKASVQTIRGILRSEPETAFTDDRSLSIRLECRPYELGWLLYAFAGRERVTH